MFPGFGTVVNVVAIAVAGIAGTLVGNRMPERMRTSLLAASGVAVIFIGAGGAISGMLSLDGGQLASGHTMLALASLVLGTFLGELADLDARLTRFGEWLKRKTGSSGDASFVEGFVTASLTVAVGAMAVVGAVNDALLGDVSTLLLKSVIDFVVILALACSLGRGCAFAALSVGVVQGLVTALALLAGPLLTEAALANLGLVGSILIFCVGVNLVWPGKLKVLNMLPAIVIAPLLAYLPIVL